MDNDKEELCDGYGTIFYYRKIFWKSDMTLFFEKS
jgi:hypothetical protein